MILCEAYVLSPDMFIRIYNLYIIEIIAVQQDSISWVNSLEDRDYPHVRFRLSIFILPEMGL